MPELGHMAYYVRNLERSVAFYQKIVGLTVVGRIFNGRAAVLSGGTKHHELLLIQVTTADGPLTGRRVGLYHVGWKVGNCFSDLQNALDRAQTYGTQIEGTADHGIMFSLYLRDPDNNEVELFVDNAECDWHTDSSWMEAPVKPLDLSIPYSQRTLGPQAKLGLRQPQPPHKPVVAAVRENPMPRHQASNQPQRPMPTVGAAQPAVVATEPVLRQVAARPAAPSVTAAPAMPHHRVEAMDNRQPMPVMEPLNATPALVNRESQVQGQKLQQPTSVVPNPAFSAPSLSQDNIAPVQTVAVPFASDIGTNDAGGSFQPESGVMNTPTIGMGYVESNVANIAGGQSAQPWIDNPNVEPYQNLEFAAA